MRAVLIHSSSSSSSSSAISPQTPAPHHHLHRQSRPSKTSLPRQLPVPPPHPVSAAHPHPHSTFRWDNLSPPPLAPDLRSSADVASRIAGDGRLEELPAIMDGVIESGPEASRFLTALNMDMVEMGLCRGLREGKLWSFIEVLRRFEKLSVEPMKLVGKNVVSLVGRECRRLLECGDIRGLVQVMETLSGFQFPIRELVKPSEVIRVCIDQRSPVLAVRYACTLPHAQILFCSIMNDFGKKGDLVSALKAYEALKQTTIGPNMFVYRTIIDVCGFCEDSVKSRYIYEDLLNQKVTPNIYVFNSLMNVNAHDLTYTLHIYNDMRNLNVKADMASYNILLKACCLAGRVDLARDIYREVQDLESAGALKLDVFTYSTIIKVFADAKMWQMALKTKDDMLSAGVTPNTVTWSSLISACANAGLVEQSIQLYEEMLQAGCEPNSQCCNTLLHACVEACQYDRAFRLVQAWKDSNTSKTLSGDSESITEEVLETEETSESSLSSPQHISPLHHASFLKTFRFAPTITTYNILMKACGTDFFRAKALMEEMRSVGLTPNQISWSILIDVCGGSGNVEGAVQILKSMRVAKVKPDVIAYTTAIKVCVESKRLKLAFSLFDEMKRCQVQPNLVTYNTLLRAHSRYGSLDEVQQCLAIYQDMRKAGYKSNDYYLKQLIEEWCEGVIQGNNRKMQEHTLSEETELSGSQSLLLEKVAVNLQKSVAESLAVDLQGLTKVEARIVVLAVLRMIKENYIFGKSVQDDISIILGVSKPNANRNPEVKDAVIRLLQDELGLEVLVVGPKLERTPASSPIEMESSTRRPAILQRLKVRKKSLHQWLQRRAFAPRK
ncbi:hypothetical protein CDL15_Pgr020548 [Punica granatum]|uniref:Pentatricopeptide repeat-containing protein At5g02830, chloroplastic n=1 Tax=Punica granatum TaxID=22663 RepID=A0A218VX62_PUNGR|nr:hypothetical protein CDL15_Pgr020548 [Punica granatum]